MWIIKSVILKETSIIVKGGIEVNDGHLIIYSGVYPHSRAKQGVGRIVNFGKHIERKDGIR